MSVLSTIMGSGVIGKTVDKIMSTLSRDKAESRRQQIELNKAELDKAPQSKLFLWRPFAMWLFTFLAAWEIIARPVIVTYWPDIPVPPSMINTVMEVLLGGMALGF